MQTDTKSGTPQPAADKQKTPDNFAGLDAAQSHFLHTIGGSLPKEVTVVKGRVVNGSHKDFTVVLPANADFKAASTTAGILSDVAKTLKTPVKKLILYNQDKEAFPRLYVKEEEHAIYVNIRMLDMFKQYIEDSKRNVMPCQSTPEQILVAAIIGDMAMHYYDVHGKNENRIKSVFNSVSSGLWGALALGAPGGAVGAAYEYRDVKNNYVKPIHPPVEPPNPSGNGMKRRDFLEFVAKCMGAKLAIGAAGSSIVGFAGAGGGRLVYEEHKTPNPPRAAADEIAMEILGENSTSFLEMLQAQSATRGDGFLPDTKLGKKEKDLNQKYGYFPPDFDQPLSARIAHVKALIQNQKSAGFMR